MQRLESTAPAVVRDDTGAWWTNQQAGVTQAVRRLGFWSAILSAACSLLWFAAFSLQGMFLAVPDWRDLSAYAAAFTPLQQLSLYPSLVLAVTFVVLIACIHHVAPEDKQIWSLIGLASGIVYSTMATINYNIQVVAVRQSLLRGETAGLTMFLPDNPSSVFTALANSYLYMALAMVFTAPVFSGGRLERSVRWLFFAQGLTALAQIGWSMFDLSTAVFFAVSLVWVIGAPIAFVLLAVLFTRAARPPAT